MSFTTELTDKEILEIMSVLKQNITQRPQLNQIHKIMVWFSEIANKNLKSNTPEGSYCVYPRILKGMSEKAKEYVEILWDRGLIAIEIVKNDGVCLYYALPKFAVLARNIDHVIMMPIGEDPHNEMVTPAACCVTLNEKFEKEGIILFQRTTINWDFDGDD